MLFSSVSQRHFIEAKLCFVTLLLVVFGTSNTQTQTRGGIIGRTAGFPHPALGFSPKGTPSYDERCLDHDRSH